VISNAVSPALNDADLVVETLHESERDFVVGMAVTDNAVPVVFDHVGEFLKGRQSAPSQLRFPVVEKFQGTSRIFVIPELPEGFFEQIGLLDPPVGLEEKPQSPAPIQIEVGAIREQGEALTFDESPILPADSMIFAPPDVVERVGEMPQDMELVVDDAGVGGVPFCRGSEWPPHVHDGQLDVPAHFRADFQKKLVHLLLAAPFAAHPDRTLTIQIGDQDGIGLPLSNRDFVHTDGPDFPGRRMFPQKLPHVLHLDSPDLIPEEMIHLGDADQTHLLALPADEPFEPAGVALR